MDKKPWESFTMEEYLIEKYGLSVMYDDVNDLKKMRVYGVWKE